jgi:hypothetical protein
VLTYDPRLKDYTLSKKSVSDLFNPESTQYLTTNFPDPNGAKDVYLENM